jgi:kynurenine formamidase
VEIRHDDDVDRLLSSVTNWGRWGADDQIGTLNLLTAERRQRAAALVRTGHAVPLGRQSDLREAGVREGTHRAWLEERVGRDYAGAVWHGFTLTHLDALCHISTPDGLLYNGVPADTLRDHGAGQLGMEHLAAHGLCGRGVLLDLATDGPLEPGTAIRVADLERAEADRTVRVEEGDLLLVRTGQRGSRERRSGLHPECLAWLHERGVALLGSDGDSDVHPAPPGFDRWASTMHAAALPYLGLPLLDGAELDPLAARCRAERQWEFLLTVSPWRLTGTTSAPVNPLALL